MRAIALCLLLAAAPAAAQDTLRLPELQAAAVRKDPRSAQIALQEEASSLRLRNLATARLPQLLLSSEATHQSEVPGIPISLPGASVPRPPKDRYDATLGVEQRLLGAVTARQEASERAGLEVQRAELAAALYPLRAEVSEAFFAAFLLQERRAEAAALTADLEARLAVVRAQAREGAALPGDTAALGAELLGAEEEQAEVAASRRAALAVLADLTGRPVGESALLALPDLSAEVARAGAPEALRSHPQYAVLAARRASLSREADLVRAESRPQLAAFGQLGYGVPGLRQFTDQPHEYWMAGIRMRWTPWSWGAPERKREVLQLQSRLLESEEAALAARLGRQVHDAAESMARLRAALGTDESIIALREQVERQTRAQLAERAVTPAIYVDARTRLQQARLARDRHRVELARAEAQYLTTLGVEIR
jgi:outer membrane protein TolC